MSNENAVRIISKAREIVSPGVFYEQEMAAARALFREFVELLYATGFPNDREFHGKAVTTNGTTIFLNVENDGRISLAHRAQPDKRAYGALEYDTALSKWVGTEPDHSIVPTPGQPIPRVPALEALATAFYDLVAAHQKKD